jgi:hypothetical protein
MRMFGKALSLLAIGSIITYALTIAFAPSVAMQIALAAGQLITDHPTEFIGSVVAVGALIAFRALVEFRPAR